MCSIAGILNLKNEQIQNLQQKLELMNKILKHRGPDDSDIYLNSNQSCGLAHNRLSIIDLTQNAKQPMKDQKNIIVFNGEIYNYEDLKKDYCFLDNFKSESDTEVLLKLYNNKTDFLNLLKGMWSFAIYDEQNHTLFCSRDRFGIKPLYYTIIKDEFIFASEVKGILPFINTEINLDALQDYLTFQFTLGNKTLFKNVYQLEPGNNIYINNKNINITKYWNIDYHIDTKSSYESIKDELEDKLIKSIKYHLVSDVPIGCYLSGGLDSSFIASVIGKKNLCNDLITFNGRFSSYGSDFDEADYAFHVANQNGFEIVDIDITPLDYIENIEKLFYHLDYPVAGPASFSQYMVSKLASKHRKVVLGGQGGDEIFAGYIRYLVAYFELCIKNAIDGKIENDKFIVTYESIIPNLIHLKNYKPMLKEFWSDGLFEDKNLRYLKLIRKINPTSSLINWNDIASDYNVENEFYSRFKNKKLSYLDSMMYFDFETLLPSLLHVEDRVSMAFGLESRVPLLDHEIYELISKTPAIYKFKNGEPKHIFKEISKDYVPNIVYQRKDKMGFPTPINKWMKNELKTYFHDIINSKSLENLPFINKNKIKELLVDYTFSREFWGILSLILWNNTYFEGNNVEKI